MPPVRILLLDVGGVLLTDGWDRHARRRAAKRFELNLSEMEERHHLMFEAYEVGRLKLDEYLDRLVFYRKRAFTRTQFRDFMFSQSKPYPKMIDLISRIKEQYGLKVAVLNNEGRDLNAYRIRKFKLEQLADFFISSCFVHLRKPEAEIFRLALDVAQIPAKDAVYIENTPMFVDVAKNIGIRGILHTDYKSTCAKLALCGLLKDT